VLAPKARHSGSPCAIRAIGYWIENNSEPARAASWSIAYLLNHRQPIST